MTAIRFTFKETERLKREQHIQTLFRSGKAFSSFPLKCIWLVRLREQEPESPARIVIAVPKKIVSRAVGRNRIRRQIREAWRLHKHLLYQNIPEDKQLHIFLILRSSGSHGHKWKDIRTAVQKIVHTLAREIQQL